MTLAPTFKPTGRLDGVTAGDAEKQLLNLLAGGAQNVTVNLSELDYVSSAGLRVLLIAAKAAKAKGGSIVLSAPKPSVLEVLKISGFDRIIAIAP
ncbi:MAG: anti-anti-sigma regulatory factor [Pseudomonadota bacterium]|jgi:anti-anti-sigma factor